ncbi:MAG: DinB family protein [Gemmatimonadaceae bacterium]
MADTIVGIPDPVHDAEAYVARLRSALGSRDPVDVLRATPADLRRAADDLSPQSLSTPEAKGKWSIRDVVQHLADSELVAGYRLRMILAHDRPVLAGYDQDAWADRLRYAESDVPAALEDFTRLRHANLRLLERTPTADRDRVGVHAERGEESISDLVCLYAGHDIVHLQQIARIRAVVHWRLSGSA